MTEVNLVFFLVFQLFLLLFCLNLGHILYDCLGIEKRGSNIETFEELIEDIDAHVQGNSVMLSRLTMALDKALDM